MAENLPPLGVRAGPPPFEGVASPVPPADPPLWPPFVQWLMAGLIALGLVLVGWRGWGLSSYSARPLPLERVPRELAASVSHQDVPPRLVRARIDHDPPATTRKKPPEAPIDLNRASAAELMQLPGVGPTLSARIVAGRPFSSVDDLRRVKGIGVKTLENLRPHVSIGK